MPTPVLKSPTAYRPKLTVLSFGGGQDSTAILYMLTLNVLFRKVWAPEDLLVLMSDTGAEHPQTYMHVQSVIKFCDEHNIEFVFITKDLGLHNRNWQSLVEQFKLNDTIMSRFFPKTCTDNLKLQPFYKYLNYWVSVKYGLQREGGVFRGKRALVEFSEKYGPIRVLIGIAKGEESRLLPKQIAKEWMRRSIDRAYPLIWLQWDRAACQDYIRKQGKVVPPPSNCMYCPFMDKIELLWMARSFPKEFAEWCRLEQRKLKHFASRPSNYGVLHQTKTLREVLADAENKYGNWTLDQLEEYRFSHGHCTMSKY